MAILTYGVVSPAQGMGARPVTVLAGEVINPNGGCFVTNNGSGKYVVCTSTSETIAGWIVPDKGLETIPVGDETKGMISNPEAVFELPYDPAGTAYTPAVIGQCCDLAVTSTVQYAKIGTHSHDLLVIVGGDAEAGTVKVRMNPNEMYRGT